MRNPPTIDGFTFTDHAYERAIQRKVPAPWVVQTLRTAALRGTTRRGNRPHTAVLEGPLATVVVDISARTVMTVYRTNNLTANGGR